MVTRSVESARSTSTSSCRGEERSDGDAFIHA